MSGVPVDSRRKASAVAVHVETVLSLSQALLRLFGKTSPFIGNHTRPPAETHQGKSALKQQRELQVLP